MKRSEAFTLIEVMVATTVLVILILIATKIVNSASTIVTLGNKHLDVDSQIRPVLSRMATDLSQMVKRSDVDYYAKSATDPESGNDHIAFFSQVAGYYLSGSTQTQQSPVSLVAYRINSNNASTSYNRMERMGKGLLWSTISNNPKPFLFGYPDIIKNNWASASDSSTSDPDYDVVGPQIFRFEYFYLLKTGALSSSPGSPGMQDVAAIAVTIAAVDPKSRVLLSDQNVVTLINGMGDFSGTNNLMSNWQTLIDNTSGMPRQALAAIKLYQRYFYLTPKR